MPLFHLHITVDGVLVEDVDGSDLPDVGAARDDALAAARDLWASAMVKGEDLSNRSFVITSARGERLLILPFTDALPQTLRARLA